MLREQQLKIREGWQWVEGQLARGYLTVNGNDTGRLYYRVVFVVDNIPYALLEWERYQINLADPVLAADVTADGLLRTARAMWQDESLHVVPTCGSATTKHILRRVGTDGHGRKEMQVWYGESFDRPPGDGIPFAKLYDSEKEALLAACLAAPEAG